MPCERIRHPLYLDVKLQSYLSWLTSLPEAKLSLTVFLRKTVTISPGCGNCSQTLKREHEEWGCFPWCIGCTCESMWPSWEIVEALNSSSLLQIAETHHREKLEKKLSYCLWLLKLHSVLPPGTQTLSYEYKVWSSIHYIPKTKNSRLLWNNTQNSVQDWGLHCLNEERITWEKKLSPVPLSCKPLFPSNRNKEFYPNSVK